MRGSLAPLQDSGLSRGGAGKTEQAHDTPSPNKDNHDTAMLGRDREGARPVRRRVPAGDFKLCFCPPWVWLWDLIIS